MNRPRIFLSAVSEELHTARQKVAGILNSIGYDVITQDNFPTGHGELRSWLREQIDSCEGLVQLAGTAYGAEPSDIDANYGRVSYTQFEFLYAFYQKKKTWIIVIEKGCPTDKPLDCLERPRERNHPDPSGYQVERRKLQQKYITRLRKENHLRHYAKTIQDIELIIYKLRDDLGELRQQWDQWCLSDSAFKADTKSCLDTLSKSTRLTTDKIRVHLFETAEKTYQKELTASEVPTDWKERQRLRETADIAHEARLLRINDLAASIAEIEGSGKATSVFNEMTRILNEQGVDEAIAYVSSQRESILKKPKRVQKQPASVTELKWNRC